MAMDKMDSHTITDASITWLSPKAKWKISAYVNNIEDERVTTFAGFTGGTNVSIYNWAFGAPRIYGLQVSYDY